MIAFFRFFFLRYRIVVMSFLIRYPWNRNRRSARVNSKAVRNSVNQLSSKMSTSWLYYMITISRARQKLRKRVEQVQMSIQRKGL